MTSPATDPGRAVPLDHRHLTRCSADLRAATAAVEAWGRARWPGARVMHEMKVGSCRLDIAFVLPAHMIGVEIKSERDTLTRLAGQIRDYAREIPELWVAVAPRWLTGLNELPWRVGRVVVENGAVSETLHSERFSRTHEAKADEMLTAPMLHLLWRAEAHALARAHQIKLPARMPLHTAVKVLARQLTGDQIVAGVCGALRARPTTFAADPPVIWPGTLTGDAA
ncbi:sce7726 family protein [Methylobacterium sp.]|uniref:sce7726 family protein n=1 Tax=Methylobacterium sp. TaxID=409 RepID=UPI00267B9C63